ncbi:CinA family protein [Mesoplasma lactucae]|nr:CinA family protein [Mesoplasma lactucae]ATZ20242.1 competence damage-inducible protein A [Mesoplasma lactucae ATCC 49193]MCL8216991.1 hypothetical protein [Mesoplasma lactucae ATCC 49193]
MPEELKLKIQEIFQLLKQENWTMASAESFTGGGFANTITNVSGSSAVFLGSLVTYTNEMKHDFLDIDERIFKKYGAISKECATAMVVGCQKKTIANLTVAFTGNADRNVSENKPAFAGFIAIKLNDQEPEIFEFKQENTMNMNRELFKELAINFAIEKILGLLS